MPKKPSGDQPRLDEGVPARLDEGVGLRPVSCVLVGGDPINIMGDSKNLEFTEPCECHEAAVDLPSSDHVCDPDMNDVSFMCSLVLLNFRLEISENNSSLSSSLLRLAAAAFLQQQQQIAITAVISKITTMASITIIINEDSDSSSQTK